MNYKVEIGKKRFPVKLEKSGQDWLVEVGKERFTFSDLNQLGSSLFSFTHKKKKQFATTQFDSNKCTYWIENTQVNASVFSPTFSKEKNNQQSKSIQINSVMPGMVKKINIKVGDQTEKGMSLIVLEAMKMENEIVAPQSGIITHIYVHENQSVETNTPLIEIKKSGDK